VLGVAYSRDGQQLAVASAHTVKIWDTSPLTEKLQLQREARGMVRFLFEKLSSKDKVMATIRHDQTITEPLRQAAVDCVAPHYE
jgi:hypothetical protein